MGTLIVLLPMSLFVAGIMAKYITIWPGLNFKKFPYMLLAAWLVSKNNTLHKGSPAILEIESQEILKRCACNITKPFEFFRWQNWSKKMLILRLKHSKLKPAH